MVSVVIKAVAATQIIATVKPQKKRFGGVQAFLEVLLVFLPAVVLFRLAADFVDFLVDFFVVLMVTL